MDNLDEIDEFLETNNIPKLNQEESENLNRKIIPSEIEAAIQKLSINKSYGSDGPHFLKLFHKIKEERRIPKSFYKTSSILIPKPDKDTTKKFTGQYT